MISLVPKLRLGTQLPKLQLRVSEGVGSLGDSRSWSFADYIPKRTLGTSETCYGPMSPSQGPFATCGQTTW